jgi:hypothetical protein
MAYKVSKVTYRHFLMVLLMIRLQLGGSHSLMTASNSILTISMKIFK